MNIKPTRILKFTFLTLLLFGAFTFKSYADTCSSQNPCWFTKAPVPLARREFGAAADSTGNIYIVGGYDGAGGFLNDLEKYNPIADTWEQKAPMPVQRNEFGFLYSTVTGNFYTAGGYNSGFYNDVYEYNPISDTWTTKTNMPTTRFGFGFSEGNNGKLYAIGGALGNGTCTNVVEEYDPVSNTWATKAPMPTERCVLSTVVANNGLIYAIGGHVDGAHGGYELDTVEAYNASTDTWSTKASMPTARSSTGVSNDSAGNIYVTGGNLSPNTSTYPNAVQTDIVEEYNPNTDVWTTVNPLPISVMEQSAVLGSDNEVHVLGGWTSDSQAVSNHYGGLLPTSTPQLISLSPAHVWVGLKNSDDVGVKFDLKAEAYLNGGLISSGDLDTVAAGSSGFNNAKLDTINFSSFSPVDFRAGSTLAIKLYVRNACTGSGHNSGTARLWYNDSVANSQFGATVDSSLNNYYLVSSAALSTSVGAGPKQTVDVQSGAKCSAFKEFGTWSITP